MTIIRYHGHACFCLETEGYRTVIDPYADGMVDGLPGLSLEAEAVCCSHGHGDHSYTKSVVLTGNGKAAPYTLEILDTFHDDQGGSLRGTNRIHLFTVGDLRIAHLGDLGHMPEEEVLKKLRGIDCLLIPVGGFYTIGPDTAAELVTRIEPAVTIPMHYRTDTTGFDVLAHLNEFTGRMTNVKTCDNAFELKKGMEKQILVINYKP